MESLTDKYIREHSSLPGDGLAWIEKQTNIHTNYPQMLSGPVQGEFMKILAESISAKRILEIGTFTGYSACCLAYALPEDGHLDALEINDELVDLIHEGWERAGLADKISLHVGDASDTLAKFGAEGREYDLIYIDANKREYCKYYELCLPILRKGGLILVDDVMQGGKVCAEKSYTDPQTVGLAEFNDLVAKDNRTETVMLPLRDGLSIIRKK